MADDDLPNLPLLIKLLKMTTSSHDAEALSAMRKANEQLAKFGGDWERLLLGKVRVVGNPFAPGMSAAPKPKAAPPPAPAPPTPAQPIVVLNKYTKGCHTCGAFVAVNAGCSVKDPYSGLWRTFCVSHSPANAPRPTAQPGPSPFVSQPFVSPSYTPRRAKPKPHTKTSKTINIDDLY